MSRPDPVDRVIQNNIRALLCGLFLALQASFSWVEAYSQASLYLETKSIPSLQLVMLANSSLTVLQRKLPQNSQSGPVRAKLYPRLITVTIRAECSHCPA